MRSMLRTQPMFSGTPLKPLVACARYRNTRTSSLQTPEDPLADALQDPTVATSPQPYGYPSLSESIGFTSQSETGRPCKTGVP